MFSESICAIATQTGGAIAIIRVSGSDSIAIVSKIFSKDLRSADANTVHHGFIRDAQHNIVDEVVVTLFRAPHSYTGEDSVEISCHGSKYILHCVLQLLVQNGCRMAEAGEYTMRAYLNGKMDLSQAEAVADLIASQNRVTHDIAMRQLRGSVSTHLAELRDQLLHLTTLLELELDFSDHEDLEFADRTQLLNLAHQIDEHISSLRATFETGQALKQGIPVAIIGRTNVGKSTLLNRLVGDERAIVSDIHGTTRDTIEEIIDISGIAFRIIDTAGLRETSDQIEQIGIERTRRAISQARIILYLVDGQPDDQQLQDSLASNPNGRVIIVQNKIDQRPLVLDTHALPIQEKYPVVSISAKTGQNINQLKDAIVKAAGLDSLTPDTLIITSARHYELLSTAAQDLRRVIDGITSQLPSDLISEDLRQVLSTLSDITGGQITPQETLNNIFSYFCVGK